ncbi:MULTISPECIES: thiolase family protein [unclassified Parafrankia]|uniref:thiolase family protein n=1 Tax=unclassified Parafrankia TaxID=2994368 RepID=UPI000DA5C9B7|nr:MULTISPECIES: thiolase family protein [unclassified Parafrankia]TCJ40048.1 thiolase family protein [Parafrankia sp. BMG5.11]SQD95979.1 Acetyl-CoA acetyltransferase [Parafrankia sp. Ea1.12]
MAQAVIVSAVRTPIATSFKGTLRDTSAEELATAVVRAAVDRSGLAPEDVDDVILAEELAGGGDIARYAAFAAGLTAAPGQAVNRHCAASLAAVGNAAATIRAGMDRAVVAGGTHSSSMNPKLSWRVPGSDEPRAGFNPTFPYYEGATDDVTLAVGWNTALEVGITRAEMDAWAKRSHDRAIAAIDAGVFDDEIVPIDVVAAGEKIRFAVDEHPRRGSTLEKLATLKPLHPEIEGFGITAGNASGVNDAAAALMLVTDDLARERGLTPLARVRAWAALGVAPHRTGMGGVEVIPRVLERAGIGVADVDAWEINEAFAPVPIAACRLLGIPDDLVNQYGSGCSLGHPVAASGARMLTTLTHHLRRRGGGIAVAAMCAAGGQGGAVVIEAL